MTSVKLMNYSSSTADWNYFYMGKTTAGIITLILGLCSCYIWGVVMLIQGILILTMTDEAFMAKYVDTDKTFPLF